MKISSGIRPPEIVVAMWSKALALGLLLLLSLSAGAQRPQFRAWNIGIVEGFSALNANSGLPTVSGHLGRWSAELSPYAFNYGLGINHHFPVLTVFKKVHFTIDANAFFARQNANYFTTFPAVRTMENTMKTGLMGGTSVYFLQRFSAQLLIGAQYLAFYGPEELHFFANPTNRVTESGSISLQCRLFKNFAQ